MIKHSITYTSELIKNYKRAETMAADASFEALQTADGHSLLFSISSEGSFFVTTETIGSSTGWVRKNLSKGIFDLPANKDKKLRCKLFDAAQNASSGVIDCALVLTDGNSDYLYLSLGNSNVDLSWTDDISWECLEFDNPYKKVTATKITKVIVSEASDGEYIIADVVANSAGTFKNIERYYLDTERAEGYAWHMHNMPATLESDKYQSCLGRDNDSEIDGIYTFGHTAGRTQLLYQPLYNVYDPDVSAPPSRLYLPGNILPEAMAACRNPDMSTDLYLVANKSLYYFASGNQEDGSEASLLFTNNIFDGVRNLFAYHDEHSVTIWGLNRANQFFYTTCPLAERSAKQSWSYPLPLLVNVQHVSPYINLKDGGNTFFAHAEGELIIKAFKSTETSLWSFQRIVLEPATERAPAKKFSSYTTRIQLCDESKTPIARTALRLSTTSRTDVYINNLYYVLNSDPIEVLTDETGCITVVESLSGLSGASIIVSGEFLEPIEVNPSENSLQKLMALDSADKLAAARIQNADGTVRQLIPAGASKKDLDQLAAHNQQLSQAYLKLPSASNTTAIISPQNTLANVAAVQVDAGDLLGWIRSGVDYLASVVVDAAKETWNFVVKIAGKVYRAVLDCAEKVVEALEHAFTAVVNTVKDVIDYLQYLFEWGDIKRTKQVIHQITRLFLEDQINGIKDIKLKFNQMIARTESRINNWAGIENWNPLGQVTSESTKSNNAYPVDASGMLLINHFQDNAGMVSDLGKGAEDKPDPSIFDILEEALESEGKVIGAVSDQFIQLIEEYDNLSLGDVLKRLVGILASGVLSSVQVVVDAVLDIVYTLAKTALKVLDTPIHIPVISDILNEIGVEDMSILDLVCWLTAIPTTIMYKAFMGKAPFPENASTHAVSKAKTLTGALAVSEVADSAFVWSNGHSANSSIMMFSMAGAGVESAGNQSSHVLYMIGHMVSGFCSLMSCFVTPFEATLPATGNPYSKLSSALAIVGGVFGGLANQVLKLYSIKDPVYKWISVSTLGIRLLCKGLFSSFVWNKRDMGAIVDSILVIPAVVCTIWHLQELDDAPDDYIRTVSRLEEMSAISSYLNRFAYTITVNGSDPRVKAVGAVFIVASSVITTGFQFGESIVEITALKPKNDPAVASLALI